MYRHVVLRDVGVHVSSTAKIGDRVLHQRHADPKSNPPYQLAPRRLGVQHLAGTIRANDPRYPDDAQIRVDAYLGEHRAERVHRVLLCLVARLRLGLALDRPAAMPGE